MPPKIGVIIPTYKRPDLLRQAVLQWIVQSVRPDVLCINQNGSDESYEWVIEDLKPLIKIEYIHIPKEIKQHYWYLIPLTYLITDGCDVFLWADHDDIYYRDHVEKVIKDLANADATVSDTCGILYVTDKDYKYDKPNKFPYHACGGMTSTSAFNKKFALDLQKNLIADKEYYYSDCVLRDTMKTHRKNMTSRNTTVYVSHKGSHSSSKWPDKVFKPQGIQLPEEA
jgi:glycosyltransferase involved in cell wall biosynthesis